MKKVDKEHRESLRVLEKKIAEELEKLHCPVVDTVTKEMILEKINGLMRQKDQCLSLLN